MNLHAMGPRCYAKVCECIPPTEFDPNDVWSDCPQCWAGIKHLHQPPWPLGAARDEGGEG